MGWCNVVDRNFYTTELCECFRVVSKMKFLSSLTLSALVLFVCRRVFPHFIHHQNELLILLGLVSNRSSSASSIIPNEVERSNCRALTHFAGNAVVIVFLD